MAKKKNENTLSYLQMPLPSGGKYSKMTKVSFGGLNKRHTLDSGSLTMEKNISTNEYPYLTPSELKVAVSNGYTNPISMFAFDTFLIVIYRENGAVLIDYITADDYVYTGTLKSSGATEEDDVPRSVVQFNVYNQSEDIVNGTYDKKLLIFPDKKSMDFDITENDFDIKDMSVLVKEYTNSTKEADGTYPPPSTASHNYYYRNTYNSEVYKWVDDMSDSENSGWKVSIPPAMPDIKYATVHLSRLFGVSDDTVYASGFNDYTNWNLDTIDEYNESNAWMSKTQSNTKAGGNFTGITTFQGHVICFKRDFMHEIYNTKNPFRLQDIYAEGAIDNRTIQDVDGKLIFVSEDDVKIYTGSNPRIIGYNLNMSQYEYAVSGTDNRNYYLYCEDTKGNKYLYVYDTYTELWSEQSIHGRVLSFAHNKNGMYMLCQSAYGNSGVVYKMDTGYFNHIWSCETDLVTNKTVNIKHIKKLQMLVDVDDENAEAYIKVYILYDKEEFNTMLADEKAKRLAYSSNGKLGKFPIRVKPRNTANYGFKLHFEGKGYVKLYELEIFIEAGGDMYV